MTAPRTAVAFGDSVTDGLDAFGSETVPLALGPVQDTASSTSEPGARRDWSAPLAALKWVGVMVLSATTAAAAVWEYQRRTAARATGSFTIQTTPPGLAVRIDGRESGVTPLTMSLAPASYAVQVGTGVRRRDLTVNVSAGSSVLQQLELPAADPLPVATGGGLLIETEPSGQTITVDGIGRGQTPLTVSDLRPGNHDVVVRGAGGTVRRTVNIKAGETVSLVVSPTAPVVPAPGWLSVQSTIRLELRERGKLVGTTDTEQLMLPAGEHDIELVNETVGYRSTRQVAVVPGKTTTVAVNLPSGSISINAQPWAEVWIAGERVGETPIANISRRVGSYEVVLRHPQLGERRETVLVTLRQPVRLGVDMRGKQQ
jgi:PEGA domain-containing protein